MTIDLLLNIASPPAGRTSAATANLDTSNFAAVLAQAQSASHTANVTAEAANHPGIKPAPVKAEPSHSTQKAQHNPAPAGVLMHPIRLPHDESSVSETDVDVARGLPLFADVATTPTSTGALPAAPSGALATDSGDLLPDDAAELGAPHAHTPFPATLSVPLPTGNSGQHATATGQDWAIRIDTGPRQGENALANEVSEQHEFADPLAAIPTAIQGAAPAVSTVPDTLTPDAPVDDRASVTFQTFLDRGDVPPPLEDAIQPLSSPAMPNETTTASLAGHPAPPSVSGTVQGTQANAASSPEALAQQGSHQDSGFEGSSHGQERGNPPFGETQAWDMKAGNSQSLSADAERPVTPASGTAGGFSPSVTSPVTPAASAASTPQLQATPFATPQWQHALGNEVVRLFQRGEQRVSLQLTPAELGPLLIDLKVSDQQAQLQLLSATPQVRAALEQALPLLREALSAQGISLGDTYIGNQSQGEHHADQSPRGYPQRSSEPDAEVAAPLTTLPPGQSHGVDLFV